MNLYKISKGQLITVWAVALLFWVGNIFYLLDSYSPSGFSMALVVLIPGILIFYSIGWRSFNKTTINKNTNEKIKELEKETKEAVEVKLFSVSTRKLIIMSIATFGLYEIYWFYRNWKAIKDAEKSDIQPFWRGVLSVFYCYSLFKKVLFSSVKQGYKKIYSPALLATAYILLLLSMYISDYDDSQNAYVIAVVISSFTLLVLLKIQEAINFNNSSLEKEYEPEKTFSKKEIVFAVIGGILFFLAITAY